MSSKSIYLDYNATSPLAKSVNHWLASGDFVFANPMSQHSAGKAARKSINESRAKIFSSFNLSEKDHQLVIHSGATEGFATMLWSFSEGARLQGKNLLVCYSGIDHPAVTGLSEKHFGSQVKFLELEINKDLSYDHRKNFEILKDKKDNDPDLWILYHHLWVHNETGLVSPLEELSVLKSIPDLMIHVDGVQAPGKIEKWNALTEGDLWTFSAHKFGALKGVGFTLMKKGIPVQSLLSGGGQQAGLRGGTENPMGLYSVKLALEDLAQVEVMKNKNRKEDLERFIKKELGHDGDILSVSKDRQNSNTIYFFLKNLTSDISVALFDLNGLMISAGSACSSGAAKPSAVLLRSGHVDVSRNGLRLSLGFHHSDEEMDKIKNFLTQIFAKIRSHSV